MPDTKEKWQQIAIHLSGELLQAPHIIENLMSLEIRDLQEKTKSMFEAIIRKELKAVRQESGATGVHGEIKLKHNLKDKKDFVEGVFWILRENADEAIERIKKLAPGIEADYLSDEVELGSRYTHPYIIVKYYLPPEETTPLTIPVGVPPIEAAGRAQL